MAAMIREQHSSARDLAIVEKYEAAVIYLYPILQRMPRRHGNLRDTLMRVMFDQVGLFYQAAKSKQASRLYAADANMATLRFWLRFAAGAEIKAISHAQHRNALRHVAEAGAMLGAWIGAAKHGGRAGS
jgi:hypothetical protein